MEPEMVNIDNPKQIPIEQFVLPFSGKMSSNNRWAKITMIMPWEEINKLYSKKLCKDFGRLSIKPRVAIGALIIKQYKQFSDEETIEMIQENPYYQYFLGYTSYTYEPCFDPSLFVYIRRRLGAKLLGQINEIFVQRVQEIAEAERSEKDRQPKPRSKDRNKDNPNQGKLILDATVAPSNIKHPTDLDLLNQSRKISEDLIDQLWQAGQYLDKPRTYRQIARKEYLSIAKRRKKSGKIIHKGIGKQLSYLRRNLSQIEKVPDTELREILTSKGYNRLLVIQKLVEQQQEMYQSGEHRVTDRIVSIHQPQIRPIVRGKARAATEFGAKISVSVVHGYSFLDHLRWDAYNESQDLIAQVNKYRRRFGHYPEVVIGDGVYGSRENRQYLKEKGIRFSGKPLGRPKKEDEDNSVLSRKRHYQESCERNQVEGKFGEGKRCYGLGLVMAKTAETSESWIAMSILTLNIAKVMRQYFYALINLIKNWIGKNHLRQMSDIKPVIICPVKT